MQSLYSKLSILKDDEDFFKNSKRNSVIKQLQKELRLSFEEATIFSIIMSYQLSSNYAQEFSKIKDDFKLENDDYLKYLNVAYKLEKKGLFSISERRRGRSSKINPEFNIDDMIFNKLILGFDYLDEVDFSDIYSVINIIEDLIDKKEENKLSEYRFYDEVQRVFDKMEKTQNLHKLLISIQFKKNLLFVI